MDGRRADRGFLIIEVMIGMTIFFLAIVVLYSTLVSGELASVTNKDKHRALQDVRALMEQMSVIPMSSLGQVFPHDTEIPAFASLHVRNQRVRVRYDNADPTAVPLGYEVVASWTTVHGRPASLTVRGMRCR
jgi:hypothetical protein